MQPTAQQDPQTILNALGTLINQYAGNVPIPTLPSLQYTAPTVSDLSSQYQQFLNRAANDPDIVNYYQNLLNQAQGDTNIALNFLAQDYQTGVRNVQQNLAGTLAQEQLQSTQEQQQLQDTLNQRGIALTDMGGGKLQYAGGGQPAKELGQLNQTQQLRQEAENRSAQQQVTSLGLTYQKGQTSAGQSLQQEAQGLNQQEQQDIANRANQYYGLYQSGQASTLSNAQMNQQNQLAGLPTYSTSSSTGGFPNIAPPGTPGGGDAGARAAGYTDYSAYQLAKSRAGY